MVFSKETLEKREKHEQELILEVEQNEQEVKLIVENLSKIFDEPGEEVKNSYTMVVGKPYASWGENHEEIAQKLLAEKGECCKLDSHLLYYFLTSSKETRKIMDPYCIGVVGSKFKSIRLCAKCEKTRKIIESDGRFREFK